MTRSTPDPPGRQAAILDLLVQPANLAPVISPRLTAGLLGAVRQQHAVAVIEASDKSGAGVYPAVRGPSEISDAATVVGRKREEVGEDGFLEVKNRRCLLDAGQSALTAGLGGRIAPDHQQRPALSHPASLRERPRTHTRNYTLVISSN